MGRKGTGQQRIATILEQSDSGMPIAEICKQYGISERTFYRWKAAHDGGDPVGPNVLSQIARENQALKNVVAELILENRALKDELARNRRTR